MDLQFPRLTGEDWGEELIVVFSFLSFLLVSLSRHDTGAPLRLTHTRLCNQRLLRSFASLRHNGGIVKFRLQFAVEFSTSNSGFTPAYASDYSGMYPVQKGDLVIDLKLVVILLSPASRSTCVALAPVKSKISTSLSLSSAPCSYRSRDTTPVLHSGLRTCSCEIKDFYVAIVKFRLQFAVEFSTSNSGSAPAYAQKKAVSFENGYQTWGGGMKNLFRFSIQLLSTFLSKSLGTYEEYHLFSVVG